MPALRFVGNFNIFLLLCVGCGKVARYDFTVSRRCFMAALRIVLIIIFILVSVVLAAIVLMQEGKSAGLGVISGAADTYWGKNKGRSIEGKLEKITKILAVAFMLFAILLNMNIF